MEWHVSQGDGIVIHWLQVWLPATATLLSLSDPGQVVHMQVSLSPSSGQLNLSIWKVTKNKAGIPPVIINDELNW